MQEPRDYLQCYVVGFYSPPFSQGLLCGNSSVCMTDFQETGL